MDDTSSNSPGLADGDAPGTSNANGGGDDSKLYKTALCQFYLQGSCKNAESCKFAHGTDQLRTSTGRLVSEVVAAEGAGGEGVAGGKTKTKLCEKFLQFGACPFGPSCGFAHGVRELQKAVARLATPSIEENPCFKTELCNNYMMGMYCQFADKCQYAHGKHELREKPPPPKPSEMSATMKARMAAKAKKRPGYKTKMCSNFVEKGQCEYAEMCHFAHGEDELRKDGGGGAQDGQEEGAQSKNSMFCKNGPGCQYQPYCKFVHTMGLMNQFGGVGGGGGTGILKPEIQKKKKPGGGNYKTEMCKSIVENRPCPFGAGCQFAHGAHELRGAAGSAGGGGGGGAGQPNPMSAGGAPGGQVNYRYKRSMCENVSKQGSCPRGASCTFAHSQQELLAARQMDPKYKTVMCDNWKSSGQCDKGHMCIFAHGDHDLRSPSAAAAAAAAAGAVMNNGANMFNSSGFGGGYSGFPGMAPPSMAPMAPSLPFQQQQQQQFPQQQQQQQSAHPPNYKTVLCKTFDAKGYCDRGDSCSFAHGSQDLRSGGSGGMGGMGGMGGQRKTVMCRNMASQGVCPMGQSCRFAHSMDEISASPGAGFSMKRKQVPGGMMMDSSSSGGSMFGGGGAGGAGGGFNSNKKTVLCQNYQASGQCKYGDTCSFAHGESELRINSKRPRF